MTSSLPAAANFEHLRREAKILLANLKRNEPAVLGIAKSLPLPDCSADAVMGVLTLHHWSDQQRGLAELLRVASPRLNDDRQKQIVAHLEADLASGAWDAAHGDLRSYDMYDVEIRRVIAELP